MADIDLKYTPISELSSIHDQLRATFKSGKLRPLEYRRKQLYQLARMLQENADAVAETLVRDIGKPKQETLSTDLGPVVERAIESASKLEEWTQTVRPEVPAPQKAWGAAIYAEPVGTILIIAPWNYPVILSLQGLVGAIAAGCAAVVKPSELVPHLSQLLAELVPRYLDNSAYRIVNGAVPETTKLLELQWDHILYTGNGKVARIVAAAAAKHLTPTTLELGGKSPVIIDSNYDMSLAAKRVLWGKCQNAGQLCVAPDYVLISREKQDDFISAVKEHASVFYPEGPINSTSFGRIVNRMHHNRLKGLLERTNGTVVHGGTTTENLDFDLTVVKDVRADDSLMQEELFGPIIPIIPVDSIDNAIEVVNANPHPLVLYTFSEDNALKQKVRAETMSGSIVFNDTFIQLAVGSIPFGGVSESGHGAQHLKYTFDHFTHFRASIDMPSQAEPFLQARYPPYSEQSEGFKMMTATVHTPIPT